MIWIYVLAHLLGLSLTPFSDNRYFSISIFLILSIAALRLFATNHADNTDSVLTNKKILIGYLCFFALIMLPALSVISKITKVQRHSQDVNAPIYGKIYLDFKGHIDEKCLVASPLAEHLAYFSNWKTIYIPGNLGGVNKEFIQWAERFNVCYAIAEKTSYVARNSPAVIKESGDYVLVDLATWLKINTQNR